MTKEILVNPERKLPMLKKGMKINYDGRGIGEVLADEAIGSCIVEFEESKKGTSGVRDIHMGIGHKMISIVDK